MDAFVRPLVLFATALLIAASAAIAPNPAAAADGDISTWAGNGNNWSAGDGGQATSASFAYPSGVTTYNGYVYIADYAGNKIRRANISTGIISTFAGTGSAGNWGNGGAATSAALNSPASLDFDSAGNAYIADSSNAVVRKVTPGGTISIFAGTGTAGYSGDGGSATLARLYSPVGIHVDNSGNVYIADNGNHTVRKVVPGGTISTVAGTGLAGYNGDGIAATSARLYAPNGVASDRNGNLYITDTSNNRIRKVTPGGTISTFAGTGVAGYTGNGGAATSAQINGPSGIDVDSRGEVYFSDVANNRIRRIDGAGVINRAAGATSTGGFAGDGGPALSATLNSPYGLTIEADGDVKFADGNNYRVRKILRQAAPGAPKLTAVTPAGPANDNTINVKGTTEPGFTVSLYSNSSCSGTAVATGTDTAFASPGLAVTVADNTTTTFYAKATDSFGSTSGCSWSSVSYVEDSAPPTATVSSSPTTPGSGRSPSWSFSSEAGATFQCQLSQGATVISAIASCTSPKSYDLTGRADATYTFSVKATDTAGNVGTAATSDYVLDTAAPTAPTVTPGQGPTGSGRNPSWSLAGEANATFECRLDRGATQIAGWAACTPPKSYDLTGQSDGTYTLSARARDAAGNTGSVATSTYVLDTVAPAGPSVITPPTSPGNGRNPSWSFTGEAGASFECQLSDGGTVISAFASCTSPKSYDLTGRPDSTYTLAVKAKDAAGNIGTATNSNYVLDTTAPVPPSISASPTTPSSADSPSWSFSGEGGATLQCKLERGATVVEDWTTCSGSRAYPLAGEVDGTYTFSVRARDVAGNTGNPATSNFTLDRAAPSVPVIGLRPATPDNDPTPEWTFTGDGDATFECRIERPGYVVSDWGSCTSPAGYNLLAEADATYTFSVRGKDTAGNRSAAATDAFVLDRANPAPPSIDTNPGSLGSDTTPTWAFSSEAGATFECRLEPSGGGAPISDWGSCTSPKTYDVSGPGDGSYTFRVRATDTAGNTGNEATHVYQLDASLPSAPNILTSPTSPSTGGNPQWTFEGQVGETFQCRLERDGVQVADWGVCASPQAYNLGGPGNDGTYKFFVRAKDALNRLGAPATSNYVLDTTKPAVPTISASPTSPGNNASPGWSFTAESGARFSCRVMRGATEVIAAPSCTSGQTFNLGGQIDGDYTLEVVATDDAGNSSDPAVSGTYRLDRAAPAQPDILTAPTTPAIGRNPAWTFSGEAGATFECRLDRGATVIATWGSCAASRSYDLATLPDGTYTFSVRARDAAGNTGSPRTSDYVLDTAAPDLPSITSNPASPSNQRAISWSFTGEGGAQFECRLESGGSAIQDWTSCAGTKNYSLTGRPDGTYTFLVKATDAAHNTGAPAVSTYTLDSTPPGDPSIDSQPASPATDADVAWGFSGDADTHDFDCRLRRGATVVDDWTSCSSPKAYSLGIDGDYTFEVVAHDALGNPSGSASDTYTLDRSAPAAPSLDSTPATPSATPTPSWSFSGEANAVFECRLTRGGTVVSDWSGCSGSRGYNLTDEADGAYTFAVRARDEAGNTGAARTSSFALDRSVPAQPSIDTAPGVTGSSHSVAWGFSGGPDAASFECRLARGATVISDWGSCSSPKSYDLTGETDGAYTFRVRARNALNTPSAERTDVYTLDTAAPAAPSINTDPGARASSRAPAWSFTGESGASFECRLETGAGATVDDWSTCSSPTSYDLAGHDDGAYVFKVRAHDQAGNSGSPSTHTYQLDTTAPAAPDLSSAPASPGTSRTPAWKWTSESGSASECRLARGSEVVSDWAVCLSGQAFDLSGRADGTYTLQIRARDAAGNAGAERTSAYELDTTPGTLQILSGPAPIASDRHPTWAFSGESGASFACRLQQGGDVVADWSGCATPHAYDLGGRPDGDYLFTVRATDAAGNTSAGIGWPFRLDTIAPPKPTLDATPPTRDRDRTPEWSFSAEPGARFECRVEHGSSLVYDWKPCTPPLKVDLRGQEDGTYVLQTRAIDAAGNVGETVVASYKLDTTAPDAPDITTRPGRSGDDRKPKWGWRGESGATFECRLRRGGDTIKDWKACTTPQAYDLGDEKTGTYTFSVRATDAAGNTGAAATDDYELKVASSSSSGSGSGSDANTGGGSGGDGGSSGGGDGAPAAPAPAAAPVAPAPAAPAATPSSNKPTADDPVTDNGKDDGSGTKGDGANGGRGPGTGAPGAAAKGGPNGAAAGGGSGSDSGGDGSRKDEKPRKKFSEDPLGAAAESVTKVAAVIAEQPEKTAFPMGLLFVIAGFMGLQGRIDRNDPKLALAPVFADPDLEFRPPSDALAALEDQ